MENNISYLSPINIDNTIDFKILEDYEIIDDNDDNDNEVLPKCYNVDGIPSAPVLPNEFEDEKYSNLYKISYSEYGEDNYITLGYCALKNNAKEYIKRYAKEYVSLLDNVNDVRVIHKNNRIIIKYKVDWIYFYKSYETIFRYEIDYDILLNKKIDLSKTITIP